MTPAALLLALRSGDQLPPDAVEAFRELARRCRGHMGLPTLWRVAAELGISQRALCRRMERHHELWTVAAEVRREALAEQQRAREEAAQRAEVEAEAERLAAPEQFRAKCAELLREWQWMSAGQVTTALAEIGRMVRLARGKR
jgi:hypothetical protein